MNKFELLLKNSNIYKKIQQDKSNGQLSHAYLFISEDKNVLVDLTRLICSLLLCEQDNSPCGECKICRRIQKGSFTDVIEKGLDSSIKVEDISSITDGSLVGAFESELKIYVLYNVDEMNDSAGNKLLKTLEEPPKNVYFFLCANNEFALLQTIKSRTEKLYLNLFSADDIYKELVAQGFSPDKAKICAGVSQGQITRAVEFAKDNNYMAVYDLVIQTFEALKSTTDLPSFCAKYVGRKNEFNKLLDLFSAICFDLYLYELKIMDNIANKQLYDKYEVWVKDFSVEALEKIMQKIIDLKPKIFYNVNVIELIDEFLFYFLEVKIKCKK